MAQVLFLRPPPSPTLAARRRHYKSPASSLSSTRRLLTESATLDNDSRSWNSLQHSLKCNPKFSCFFSDGRKQEQARKALEGALGGKKSEFEKWDKEIRRREDVGGGGNSGGGGWFGWFGGSNGDHFWQEAQQITLTILGIIVMCLIVAKGDVMFAAVLNPLLFALRGTRNGLSYITWKVKKMVNRASRTSSNPPPPVKVSARENVVRKWGSD